MSLGLHDSQRVSAGRGTDRQSQCKHRTLSRNTYLMPRFAVMGL